MTEKKMTIRDHYDELTALVEQALESGLIDTAKADEHKAFIDGRVELIIRKNANGGKSKKQTEKQIENDGFANEVYAFMSANGGKYRVAEITKSVECCRNLGFSPSKTTSLLRALRNAGKVDFAPEKGVNYWFVV